MTLPEGKKPTFVTSFIDQANYATHKAVLTATSTKSTSQKKPTGSSTHQLPQKPRRNVTDATKPYYPSDENIHIDIKISITLSSEGAAVERNVILKRSVIMSLSKDLKDAMTRAMTAKTTANDAGGDDT
eukprot:CAMPEP_0172521078 /NCGR_PEP_ID=MMETSP1066-20121228/292370_1 /TAXON_ID=671091 /ORGANISM="Coscinodiscus wailesii, Strain CCMP2513" /LENGTH=128 /DNA_ID=CAMNT_0013303933 /DNA_START=1158 /DNA_END=1542 /DNA_ORIENTATION=-